MKKSLIIALAAMVFGMASASAATANKEIKVSSGEEFIKALGNDRTIIVEAEYIDITEALGQFPELYCDDYESETRNVFCIVETDGPEFHIKGLKNLTIKAGYDVVTFVCQPRYANVISFTDCVDLTLDGITFGHTEEGYCSQGVLGFYHCSGVEVDYCDLFGCGTEGIMVSSCQGMLFKGTKIRDCSYYIMHLYGSENILFESCQFFRNREYELVNIGDCQNVFFNNCMFANNTGNLFNIESPVTFRNCVILHDSMFLNLDNIYMENCITEEYFNSEQALG